SHRADTTGIEACLEWAECASLIQPGARAEDQLTREAWWRMLAAGVRGPALDPALAPLDLRDSLIAARVLPREEGAVSAIHRAPIDWSELARDLGRARSLGVRSGPSPFRKERHRETCEAVLGTPAPAAHVSALMERKGRPCVGEAVMLFADLA